MVKSSTPIWVLLFALLFGLEKPRILVISIIIVMVIGVILTVEGETKFDMTGFVLVLTASVMSGLRWSLTQLLLQHDSLGMDNPVATLYHLSPVMFVTMATLSLIFEDPIGQFRHSEHFDSAFHVVESFGLMAIGGLLGKLCHTNEPIPFSISPYGSLCNDLGGISSYQKHKYHHIERGWN
jgi:drug/metabolite transporter (DMT)-like permease